VPTADIIIENPALVLIESDIKYTFTAMPHCNVRGVSSLIKI